MEMQLQCQMNERRRRGLATKLQEHKVRKLGDPHTAAVIATFAAAMFATALFYPGLRENARGFFDGSTAREVPRKVAAVDLC